MDQPTEGITMSYSRGATRQKTERNPVTDQDLQDALRAHAKGSVDVVIAIASNRSVRWADALDAYPQMFADAAQEVQDRIARARENRR
jgi:hypothetical protein